MQSFFCHRCHVQNCDLDNSTVQAIAGINQPDWISYAIPVQKSSSNFLAERGTYDSCSMYKIKLEENGCTPDAFDNNDTIACDRFVYDNTYFDENLTTKFDLVCEMEYKAQLLGSVLVLGILIGSIFGGRLGDRFGRKLTMCVAAALIIPLTAASGFAPNYGGE